MLKPFEFHQFVPISVLLDAVLVAFIPPPPLCSAVGGYSGIVLLDKELVIFTLTYDS